MASLGGSSLFLRGEEVGLGVRESIADFARVISQYVDALAIRTHAHSKVEELAKHATIPIINALSEDAHPCQAMADVLTIREVRLAAGAEFIVLVCGDIMTMPGLPRVPAAEAIDVDDDGNITGLF